MFISIHNETNGLESIRVNTDLIEYYQLDGRSLLIKFVSKEFVKEYSFDSEEEAKRCLQKFDNLCKLDYLVKE